MSSLRSRERVTIALNREEPDRVPLDTGGTPWTTMVVPAYQGLKEHLGLDHETRLMVKRAQTVIPDDVVLDRLDVDFVSLNLGDFRGGNHRELDTRTLVDAWGTTWKRAPGGHYINVDGPFQKRGPKLEILETHQWPDPNDPGLFDGLKEKAAQLRKNSDRAIVLSLPVGIVHHCQFLRGYAEWLMDLLENPEFACCMMDFVADIWIKIAENALNSTGDNVDVVAWGDDVAIQEATLMSPKVYRELIKPRHRRMIEAVRSRSNAKIHYHSCGSVYAILEDLIEIGIDALNPIQISARDMDPATLKREFGDRLAFWGGIDTQRVLPYGNPTEVREEVRKTIDCLGKGGGYVLAGVHNIQGDVPPENIVAMFEEGRNYSIYRH
jgi:uroporphyrinogen decarboxylase